MKKQSLPTQITSAFLGITFVFSVFLSPLTFQKVYAADVESQVTSGVAGCAGSYLAGKAVGYASSALEFGASAASTILTVPVHDAVDTFVNSQSAATRNGKEYILDCLAYTASRVLIGQMTTHINKWINQGIDALPGTEAKFITRYQDFFKRRTDEAGLRFLKGLGDKLPDSYGPLIKRELLESHYVNDFESKIENTFPQEHKNFIDKGDFTDGGWAAYRSFNSNNAFESSLIAQSQMNAVQQAELEKQKTLYEVNDGFLSSQICLERYKGSCVQFKITTPGKLIAEQISNLLGTKQRQLEQADELNEILANFFTAMLMDVFGGGDGLLDSSSSSGSGGGGSTPTISTVGIAKSQLRVQMSIYTSTHPNLTPDEKAMIEQMAGQLGGVQTTAELSTVQEGFQALASGESSVAEVQNILERGASSDAPFQAEKTNFLNFLENFINSHPQLTSPEKSLLQSFKTRAESTDTLTEIQNIQTNFNAYFKSTSYDQTVEYQGTTTYTGTTSTNSGNGGNAGSSGGNGTGENDGNTAPPSTTPPPAPTPPPGI